MRTFAAIVFILLFAAAGSGFAYDSAGDARSCKADLEAFLQKHLDPLKENFEPAEYRVQIADLLPPKLEIYVRTLPDAYLIGFDPASGRSPLEFMTPENKAVLMGRAFEPVLALSCPSPYPKDFFAQPEIAASMQFPLRFIQFIWGFQKDTPELHLFIDRFDAVLEPRLEAIARVFAAQGKFLRHQFSIFDKYTDSGFETLVIIVNVFAVVWDGNGGTHKDMLKDLDLGLHDADKRKHYEATLDMRKTRNHEAIEKDIERIVQEMTDKAILYMEGVLRAKSA